jgi:uncharacterized protein YlxW (UPF0749 family)
VAAVLVVAGLVLAASAGGVDDSEARGVRGDDLAAAVEAAERRVEGLAADVEALRSDIRRLEDEAAAPGVVQETTTTAATAGFVPVQGPGLRVTLDDAEVPSDLTALPEGVTPDDYVIHQQDVDAVLNALWAGGAEAVAVMDQRVVATSSVRCVGNVIIVDGIVFSPPFVVEAIGNAPRMRAALDASPQVAVFREWASFLGLGYATVDARRLVLPAAPGPPALQHASVPEPAA